MNKRSAGTRQEVIRVFVRQDSGVVEGGVRISMNVMRTTIVKTVSWLDIVLLQLSKRIAMQPKNLGSFKQNF